MSWYLNHFLFWCLPRQRHHLHRDNLLVFLPLHNLRYPFLKQKKAHVLIEAAIADGKKGRLTDSNLICLSYRCASNLNNAISGWFSSFYWPVGEVNTYSCLVRANSLIERESCPVWNLYLFQCMNRKQLNTLSFFFSCLAKLSYKSFQKLFHGLDNNITISRTIFDSSKSYHY